MVQINQADYVPSQSFRAVSRIFDLGRWFFPVIALMIGVNTLFFTISIIEGNSMLPNFTSRSIVLVDRRSGIKFRRADVIVLRYPGDPQRLKFVKRIIGLPGETVTIVAGRVAINGAPLAEPYLSSVTKTISTQELRVSRSIGQTEYFVLGDNRGNSTDSRVFGSIERSVIVGKIIFVLYQPPLQR